MQPRRRCAAHLLWVHRIPRYWKLPDKAGKESQAGTPAKIRAAKVRQQELLTKQLIIHFRKLLLDNREETAWEKTAQRHGEIYNETLQKYYEKHGMPKSRKGEEEMAEAAKDEADMFNN